MAREHARVKLSIWEDDDYRDLSVEAQHLYQVLMIHPQLNYCGVTDWRPAKLSGFARGWSAEDVEMAAKELSEQLYIVIDERTEEVLIRSFIRNDELLDSPNMAVAVRKAHMAIASKNLRGVIVHELIRLREDKPDLKGWSKVEELLGKGSVNPSEIPSFNPSVNPSGKGSVCPSASPDPTPSGNPSGTPSPTTAPTPAPLSKGQEQATLTRGSRLVDDWKPTEADVTWQREKGISDLLARRQLESFVLYWTNRPGKDGVKLDWSKTWRRWLLTEQDRVPANTRPTQPSRPNGWEFGMDR